MRLTDFELMCIKQTFLDIFKDEDIDLYIKVKAKQDLLNKKIQFLAKVKEKIGDQKIDVIISKDETRIIEQEAIAKGIKL